MRDIVIVFAVLLVLLLVISTLGGSIRHSVPPQPVYAAGFQQHQGPLGMMGSPPYNEGFAEEEEVKDTLDTYAQEEAVKQLPVRSVPKAAAGGEPSKVTEGDISIEAFAQQDKEFAKW